LADNAANPLPTSALGTGTFRPGNTDTTTDAMPAPAPAAPYDNPAPAGSATLGGTFGTTGTAMNGTWALYVKDDAGQDTGSISGGWSMTFEANDYACSIVNVKSRADFDGDGKTDLSVYRNGTWYINGSQAGFSAFGWGNSTDTVVPGDFDSDGKTDAAVFRPTADPAQPDWYVLNSNGFTATGASWGTTGDVPVVADYDNDGKSDIAIFRPSTNQWFVLNSGGTPFTVTAFGQAGDVPVAGNFGGTAAADFTVYRNGTFMSQLSGGGTLSSSLGTAGDILVPADYDNDNVDDYAVFRPSTGQWIVRNSNGGSTSTTIWGVAGDVPVPGDYDGDGRDDLAIYRNGQWWMLRSTAGTLTANFGLSTDIPVPRRYLP
jgi:hypothetical protein